MPTQTTYSARYTARSSPVVLALFAAILSWHGSLLAAADSDDERFLAGLRARRLFLLADRFAHDRLNDADLPADQRARLVIELIRTQAAHAVNSPPLERMALWEKAHATAAEFRRLHADNPRLVLVRVQDALTALARGELLRQEAEIGAGPPEALENAKAQIRRAAEQLRDLDAELTKEIPLRNRSRPEAGELTAEELISLQHNVVYQLARAYRNQGLCYERGSDDRIASLSRALEQLAKPLTQLPAGDPLIWRIYLDQVICRRLLEDFEKAAATLTALEAADAPAEIRLEARAEKARIAAARGRLDEALSVLNQGRTIDGKTSAAFDFALLEVYLAMWQEAAKKNDDDAAEKWQKLAVSVVDALEQQHGAYWSRRGELLLVRSAAASGGARDIEIVVRTADNFYLQKQFDEAIAAYDQAAQQAAAAGDNRAAFELAYKAAAVVHLLKRHQDAARRMRSLSVAQPEHPTAGKVHLQGIVNASLHLNQSLQTEQAAAALAAYAEMLAEHLKTWPASATANDARLWLGGLRAYQQQWPQAIAAYLGVTTESAAYEKAVASAADCSRKWFDELKAKDEPYDQAAIQAADYFEQLIYGGEMKLPETWDAVSRLAAVTAARIRLQHTSNGHKAAGDLLAAAVDGSPDAPPEWKSAAVSLLVVALAGQPTRRGEALARLRQLADGDPAELLEMLSGLAAMADAARPDVRKQTAPLLIEAVDLLAPKRNQLDDRGKLTLDSVRANAFASAGRRNEAEQAYNKLAQEHPNNSRIQRGYAEFLMAAGDKKTLEKALGQWRLVAVKTKPQTEPWFEAKYSVALALFKLGRPQEAATLIRYLQATPPGLNETRWKASLLQLLARCE